MSETAEVIKTTAQEVHDNEIVSYKGFDNNFSCHGGDNPFQYEVGKTYEMDGPIAACSKGFHACEYPLNVFKYYAPASSRFAAVRQSGQLSREKADTKVASTKITIDAELHIPELVERAIDWVMSRCDPAKEEHATGVMSAASATGVMSAASATGYQGAASATGVRSAASATGYQGAASATGIGSVAMAIGLASKAKAGDDGAIVCVFRDNEYNLVHIRAAKIGGPEGIKPDVYYTLDASGNFVEG